MRVHEFFEELRDLLLKDEDLKDLIGSKIFPYKVPESASKPYVTIRSKEYDRNFTISITHQWLTFGSLDFWIYGENPSVINQIQEKLEDILHLSNHQTDNIKCRNIVCIAGQNAFQPDVQKYPDLYTAYSTFRAEVSIK